MQRNNDDSVAVETGAGRRGRHGDSAARPAARASSCASAPATTRHPGTAGACAWDPAGRRGEEHPEVHERNIPGSMNAARMTSPDPQEACTLTLLTGILLFGFLQIIYTSRKVSVTLQVLHK